MEEYDDVKTKVDRRVGTEFLVHDALKDYKEALKFKNVHIMNEMLEFIEGQIISEIDKEYYIKLKKVNELIAKSYNKFNPLTDDEHNAITKNLVYKALKFKYKLICKYLTKSGMGIGHLVIDDA